MRWRGRQTSSNVEDRRGGSFGYRGSRTARRAGGIGGIGVIAVLLIGLIFGVDVTPLLQGGDVSFDASSTAPDGPNEINDQTEEFVAVVLRETETVWSEMFEASGYTYVAPTLVLFQQGTSSGCGFAQSAMGPFYCPQDRRIFLDTDFFRVMEQQLGSRGEFAKAYVIAHEVAHHVQNELGLLGQVNQVRANASEEQSNAMSVRIELQADCYAGVWANRSSEGLALSDDDIRSALDTAARIGDDALQRASGGRVVPDSFTHGSSAQRQDWFHRGYRSGDPDACDTFKDANLE
jgi:uncharacterized protein